MRAVLPVAAVALLVTAEAQADSLALQSVNRANTVIDEVIEAYGGAERLNGIKTVMMEADTVSYLVNQSRGTEAPWDKSKGRLMQAIDLENDIFVNRASGDGAGFEFETGTIINGDASYQLDYRAGSATPQLEPDFNTTSGPFVRVTSVLLVRQLMERRQTSHWLGETEIDGRPHDVITLVMEVGPGLSLYFDQETRLLSYSERLLPPFGAVEYHFRDYYTLDGVPMNKTFHLSLNGDPNLDWTYTAAAINQPLDELAEPPAEMARLEAVGPDELRVEEMATGVYHIGGNGTYAMFVDMDDHVVAIGGTAGVPERLAELRKVVGDKPVRYGVMTHHHSDHVLSVPTYADEGAKVVIARAHKAVMEGAAGESKPDFVLVDDTYVIKSGKRRIELHNIGPTPHAEDILIAYLPKEGIVFEADHTNIPRTGPMPPAISNTRALVQAMTDRGWKVKRIAGAHSPRTISMAELTESLDRELQAAAQ